MARLPGPPGVAPPPMQGPRQSLGSTGGSNTYKRLVKLSRDALDLSVDAPELARDLNPIVERLIKLIEQSVAPRKRPGNAGPPSGPTLDESPTGASEEPESSMASMLMRQFSGPGA